MLSLNNELDIDIQQVLQNIGYSADSEPATRITSLVSEYIENVHQLIEPAYSYVIKDIESVRGSSIIIEGSIVFKSEIIARLLEQCEKVAVFALTIGSHLEETIRHLAEDGLILQAAVLDGIGSDAAERMADLVQNKIGRVTRDHGFCMSQRFSPGYCDWDVSQQAEVFQALGSDSAGIHLSREYLMLPKKSVSGIIGIGSSSSSVDNYIPCKICDEQGCMWRR